MFGDTYQRHQRDGLRSLHAETIAPQMVLLLHLSSVRGHSASLLRDATLRVHARRS